MSRNILNLMAANPLALPSQERRGWVRAFVRDLFSGADEITIHATEEPAFFPAIENHELTLCPNCSTDITKWAWDALDPWYARDRRDLSVVTPCCAAPTTLNDLDYRKPQGFACFSIEVLNPTHAIDTAELAAISARAGTPMRIVWTRC